MRAHAEKSKGSAALLGLSLAGKKNDENYGGRVFVASMRDGAFRPLSWLFCPPPDACAFFFRTEREQARVVAAGVESKTENRAKAPERKTTMQKKRRNEDALCFFSTSTSCPPLHLNKKKQHFRARHPNSANNPQPWAKSPSASARSSTPSPPSSRP